MAVSSETFLLQDVSGLWVQAIDEAPDPALGDTSKHGTFTRSIYVRAVHAGADHWSAQTATGPGKDSRILYLFDEQGEAARFEWKNSFVHDQGKGAWVSVNQWITFLGYASVIGADHNFSIAPNLVLKPGTDDAVPADLKSTGCPGRAGTATIDRKLGFVPGMVPQPEGSLNDKMPLEYVIVSMQDPDTMTWRQRDVNGQDCISINLTRARPTARRPKVDSHVAWSDMFASNTYPEVESTFVGYNPALIDFAAGKLTGTGRETWDKQNFIGKRIFQFPTQASGDYAKSSGGDGKVLPLGTIYAPISSGTHSSKTVTVSTENEHCTEMALTLGLSGGIEGVGKASGSLSLDSKTQQSTKNLNRYTVSQDVDKSYALLRNLPDQLLEEEFLNRLGVLAITAIGAPGNHLEDSAWASHEQTYGSHYANAATFGAVQYLRTTLTETTETYFAENGIEIKRDAEAALDGVEAGSSVDVKKTWGDKYESVISDEDLEARYVGKDAASAMIYLDLRAANELLNPVLLPWDPSESALDPGVLAPFLSYVLRQSWLDYQRRAHSLDVDLAAIPDVNWTRYVVKFTVNATATAAALDWPSIYGTLDLLPDGPARVVSNAGYNVTESQAHKSDNGAVIPGTGNVALVLIGTQDEMAQSRVGIDVRLHNWHVLGSENLFVSLTGAPAAGPDGVADTCAVEGSTSVSVQIIRANLNPKP